MTPVPTFGMTNLIYVAAGAFDLASTTAATAGSVIVNTAPPPGPEAASMFPPCSRSTVLQMLSPRPVPRPGRLVVKNGSKMWHQVVGGDSRAIILKYHPHGIGISSDAHTDGSFVTALADRLLGVQ